MNISEGAKKAAMEIVLGNGFTASEDGLANIIQRIAVKPERDRYEQLKANCVKHEYEITTTLGTALYGVDKETGLPCWGDHVSETLALVAVDRLNAERERAYRLAMCLLGVMSGENTAAGVADKLLAEFEKAHGVKLEWNASALIRSEV